MISKHSFVARLWAGLAGIVVVGLMTGSVSVAQQGVTTRMTSKDTHTSQANYVELDAKQASKTGSGPHEGITMHGHWVIDVKNPDGSVAEHRDFENALQGYGAELLTGLLSGYVVPSDYSIFVQPASGAAPCAQVGNTVACAIVRSLTTLPGSTVCAYYTCSTNLTYTTTLNDNSAFGSSFVLAGSFTASQAGTIATVSTLYGSCPANIGQATALTSVAPTTCSTTPGSGGFRNLSATSITPINVVSSQIVQITVTITFS